MKLVLFSGGVDSSTCLGMAKTKDTEVKALFIHYGQRHGLKELEAAKKVADYYQVELLEVDLSSVFIHGKSSLTNIEEKVTQGDYADQENSNTEVEFRNGIFLSVTSSLAMQIGADQVYFGAHMDDSGFIYPDCSPDFVNAMTQAIKMGTGEKVTLLAPFLYSTKSDLVAYGKSIGVPYELTYSCYNGSNPACGKCGTCIDRKKAFEANGLDFD